MQSRLYVLTLILSVVAGCAATLETAAVRDANSAGVRYELAFQLPGDLPDEAVDEFDRQLEAAQAQAQADVRAQVQRLGIDPEAVTFTTLRDDGRLGLRVDIDPIPQERLNAVPDVGDTKALIRRFAVDQDGDRMTLNAQLVGESTLSAPAAAGKQFAAGNNGFGQQPLTVVVAVRLPGQVTNHNADRVSDDGALVWYGRSQPRTLTAQADVGRASMLPLLGAVVALLLAAGLFVLWRRRRGPAGAGRSAGWSVTADDPAARGAVFPLAPTAPSGNGAGPEKDATPDEDLVVPDEVAAPEEDLVVPDADLASEQGPASDAGPAPRGDAAWWHDEDDDDDDTGPARAKGEREPAWHDEHSWDDESAWEADEQTWDMEVSPWNIDEPGDESWEIDEPADDPGVQDPSSDQRR